MWRKWRDMWDLWRMQKMHTKLWLENSGKRPLQSQGVDWYIVLKLIFDKDVNLIELAQERIH